jgi:hypothetical protein
MLALVKPVGRKQTVRLRPIPVIQAGSAKLLIAHARARWG